MKTLGTSDDSIARIYCYSLFLSREVTCHGEVVMCIKIKSTAFYCRWRIYLPYLLAADLPQES